MDGNISLRSYLLSITSENFAKAIVVYLRAKKKHKISTSTSVPWASFKIYYLNQTWSQTSAEEACMA